MSYPGELSTLDLKAQVVQLQARVAELKVALEVCREGHRLMASYLGHQDQDANHEWMFRKMRELGAASSDVLARADDLGALREFGRACLNRAHGSPLQVDITDAIINAVLRGDQ